MKTNYPAKKTFTGLLLFLLISLSSFAQVGIGTTTPKTELDVNGALSLRTGGNLSLNAGANNNVSLGATPYSFYRVAASNSNFTINSIVTSSAGATDGQIITLENNSTGTMTLAHNGGGTNRNRILCPGGRNLTLSGRYATATLMYETNHNRWVVTSYADNRYGDNIQYSKGTTDILTGSTSFSDMADMTITFTPNHSVVYVSFSAAGHMDLSVFNPEGCYAEFQLVNVTASGAIEAGTTSLATDYDYDDVWGEAVAVAWNAQIAMFPVTVTPGVSNTLKIQWLRDGNHTVDLTNDVASYPQGCHRSLTIFD